MKKLVLLIVLLTSMQAVGSQVWVNSKIKMVYPQSNGIVAIVLKNPSPECGNASDYMHIKVGEQSVTQEAFNNMYSLVLLAAASEKNMQINFESSSSACFINKMFVEF